MIGRTLNVGCGLSMWGTTRVDLSRGSATDLGDAARMPYRDGSFDEVLADWVLEHQPNPLQFLLECQRVLRPGGLLRLATDNAGYCGWWPARYRFIDRHGTYVNPRTGRDRHYAFFTDGHLRNLFWRAGFEDVHVDFFTRWPLRTFDRVQVFFSERIGHAHLRATGVRPSGSRS